MNSLFKNNILSITIGTSLSKVLGFLRQIAVAAAFGVGIAYDAYNYAYIIPGFLIIIVAGINGPLHNAIVTILTPVNSKKASLIFTRVSTKLSFLFFFIGIFIFFKANFFIKLLGPHLNFETQQIAIKQLKILSPCIPFSAFIGLSFGALNSKNKFFLASISPSFISLTTIIFIYFSWIINNGNSNNSNLFRFELLAIATLAGTFIQFLIQIYQIKKIGFLSFNNFWSNSFNEEKRIFNLILPASLSSGLSQINIFVDMYFISSFPGAASGLAYANFLIQAPLGILSNSLILPLLPKISLLNKNRESKKLEKSLKKIIEYTFFTTFFLGGIFIVLNEQIIEIIFQRGAFNYEATSLVKNILVAYSFGIPFYLLRDLLVRIYYALEKTRLPFRLSLIGILLNILLDWAAVGSPFFNSTNLLPFNFGVMGIVIASGIVNFISCIVLSSKLRIEKINILNQYFINKIILIFIACILAALTSIGLINLINFESPNLLNNLIVSGSGFISFSTLYFCITKCFKVNKIKINLRNLSIET